MRRLTEVDCMGVVVTMEMCVQTDRGGLYGCGSDHRGEVYLTVMFTVEMCMQTCS